MGTIDAQIMMPCDHPQVALACFKSGEAESVLAAA